MGNIGSNKFSAYLLRGWLVLLLLSGSALQGQSVQSTVDGVRMIGTSNGREVRLRWAPTNWPLWEQLRESGVYLERNTILRNGEILPEAERLRRVRLVDTLLRPASPGIFAVLAAKDQNAAVAGQAFYGTSFQTNGDPAAGGLLSRARETENRYSFGLFAADQSFEVAQAMALGFVDDNVDPRETYVYRLRAGDPSVRMDTLTYGFVSVNVGDIAVSPKITGLEAEFRDKQVILQWPLWPANEHYTSYYVERSEDGVNWHRRNAQPFLPLLREESQQYAFFNDTLPRNGRPYFYRVIGNTAFGESGSPSDPIQGSGVPTAGQIGPYIRAVVRDDQGGLRISWDYEGARTQVQRVSIQRAPSARGPYADLSGELPGNRLFYTDAAPLRSNYYKVVITDVYDRQEESFEALGMPIDSIPPGAPDNVRGVILKDGQVILSWDENPEADCAGYRVFLSNRPESEFRLASNKPERGNYYVGQTTLNTLSNKLYAKVTAMDFHGNTSAFSVYATLERPDTIPPSQPVFTAVVADSNGVTLGWEGSRSPDVDYHALYRKAAGDVYWSLVERFPYPESVSQRAYLVANLEPDAEYAFRLDAVDRSELRSATETVRAARIGSPLRRAVEKVAATPDRRARKVNLRWNYQPDRGQLTHFTIYRALQDAEPGSEALIPQMIGQLPATTGSQERRGKASAFTYADPTPKMNTTYRYFVRALYADGGMSRLSPAAEVTF